MNLHYDGSQEQCPVPLVKLRLLLKKMQRNDTCIIKIADRGSRSDIPKLLNKLGYQYRIKKENEGVVELTIWQATS